MTRVEARRALDALASLHDQYDERELRAALTSLRDAPLTDAAAAHLARSCPGFVACALLIAMWMLFGDDDGR